MASSGGSGGDSKKGGGVEAVLDAALRSNSFTELVALTVRQELNDGGQSKAQDFEMWYALQLVGHLLCNDL